MFCALVGVFFLKPGLLKLEKWKKISLRREKLAAPQKVYKSFEFSSEKSLKGWKNKIFKGKTKYWLDGRNSTSFLHSKSEDSASALYHFVSYKVEDYPLLRWTWRPVRFPVKKDNGNSSREDDYALRIYVVFASVFFSNFRCIEYIWDEYLPVGTEMTSPYSDNIKQLIVESGSGDGLWLTEERNVRDDYERLFGQQPKSKIKAIAIMTDSEGSHDLAEANFRDIKIFR